MMNTKIALLPDERVVMGSEKDILTLTTRRVRYDSAVFGSSKFISVTLDSVASCGLATRSLPILLWLGAASLIGAFTQRGGAQLLLVGVAVACAAIYIYTRRATISIASNGGEMILVPAKGMSRSSIIEFLEAVEREKLSSSKAHQ